MDHTYRIVVGVDGSEGSLRALRWAAREAQNRGGTVQAIMAYDWAGTEAALLAGLGPDAEHQRALDVLAAAVAEVTRDHRRTTIATEVLLGQAAHQLTQAARDADLLVVGSHGHGRLHHAVLGSVSEACIRLSPCPVVVVPTPHPTPEHATDIGLRPSMTESPAPP